MFPLFEFPRLAPGPRHRAPRPRRTATSPTCRVGGEIVEFVERVAACTPRAAAATGRRANRSRHGRPAAERSRFARTALSSAITSTSSKKRSTVGASSTPTWSPRRTGAPRRRPDRRLGLLDHGGRELELGGLDEQARIDVARLRLRAIRCARVKAVCAGSSAASSSAARCSARAATVPRSGAGERPPPRRLRRERRAGLEPAPRRTCARRR